MLSSNYTIAEIKLNLMTYSDYDYSSESDYTSALITILETVKYEKLYHLIGSYYDNETIEDISLAAYNRADFLEAMDFAERSLFFAEVFYTCAEFLRQRSLDDIQSGEAESSYSIEGYSQNSKSNPNKKTASIFENKARTHLLRAGIDIVPSISRTRPRGIDVTYTGIE
jgi:hypothetical protein